MNAGRVECGQPKQHRPLAALMLGLGLLFPAVLGEASATGTNYIIFVGGRCGAW